MTDVEQRAQKLLDDIQQRKNEKLADKIFREPKRREAEKEAREKAEAEQLKQLEERWSPWIEKAMQRAEQEREERDKLWSKFK